MFRLLTWVGALAPALLLACAASAQPPAPARAAAMALPQASPATPSLDAADLGAFFDGFLPYALHRGDIAGAAVAVVKDGRVVFARGYGDADLASHRPVDPATTLFRMGSISKVITWTAVMHLVEQGKLDLDRDVNAYLDFRIPPRFGKPITLRELMTHSAGFEESYKQLMSPDGVSMPGLEVYVKRHLPTRIYPPGAVIAYSNYGATLAGYIVQRVSGEPFAAYAARHIFQPLGMRHSTFAQPVPPPLRVATGYKRASLGPFPFEYASDTPAGALSSTADDMARFLIAQLNGGALGDARILRPATVALMHRTARQDVPPLPGMALGFYGEDRNGHRIIGHAGDLISFHADLHMLPDDGVGFFIAMNSWGSNNASTSIRTALFRAFLDRYFPAPIPHRPTMPTAHAHGLLIAGRYSPSRRSVDNFASLATLFGQGVLTLNPDDTVSFSVFRDEQGKPKRWREVAPFVWREEGGRSRLVARMAGGRVAAIGSDDSPLVELFLPTPGARSAGWNVPLIVASIVILSGALLLWLIGFGRRFVRRGASSATRRPRAEYAMRATAAADLLFLLGWAYVVIASAENPAMLGPALDPELRLIQILGWLGIAGLPLVMWSTARAWRARPAVWAARTGRTLLLVACVATLWAAFAFHLLAPRLTY